jgi:hypothetical protein
MVCNAFGDAKALPTAAKDKTGLIKAKAKAIKPKNRYLPAELEFKGFIVVGVELFN